MPKSDRDLEKRLAIVSDDAFAYFTKHGTEVTARIALEPGTKNASSGALFYEEFIPPESLFYSLCFLNGSAKGDELDNAMNKILQIGGDATIGKGLCQCKKVEGGAS